MKCQHCGINYSDEDRECPICGARAGTRGRVGELEKKAAAWREKQFEDEPTYQKTRTRKTPIRAKKAKPSVKPIRETQKGKGKIAAVVAVAVVLLNLLPSLVPFAEDFLQNVGDSVSSFEIDLGDWGASEPDAEAEDWVNYNDGALYYTPGATYEYDPDNYTSVYVRLYDLIGDNATATLSDGTTLNLWVDADGGDGYGLSLTGEAGTYEEKGYYWCMYNYPEEQMYYDDNYPPEQYDSLALCLTMEETSYGGITQPDGRYDVRLENADLWLIAYVDRDTGLVTLQDVDNTGIFGADMFVALNSLQQG